MATINVTNPAANFVSGDEVNPNNLNALGLPTVTVSGIVSTDISASAAIAASQLSNTLDFSTKTLTLPSSVVTPQVLASSSVETAKINNAAVTAPKLSGAQTGDAPIYGVRAWVNFDGTKDTTGTVSTSNTNRQIRQSGNVSSVLRNAVGDYTVTFATAMPDASYTVVVTTCGIDNSNTARHGVVKGTVNGGASNKTTAAVSVLTGATNSSAMDDVAEVNVMILR
jgi:hypothetical protein